MTLKPPPDDVDMTNRRQYIAWRAYALSLERGTSLEVAFEVAAKEFDDKHREPTNIDFQAPRVPYIGPYEGDEAQVTCFSKEGAND